MPQLTATVEGVVVKQFRLTKNRTTLGRRPHNDIVFENLVFSGDHCVFDLIGIGEVWIEDLGSTNGTYVNGTMVKRQQLHDKDVIAIGNFKIHYQAHADRPEYEKTTAMRVSAPAARPAGTAAPSGAGVAAPALPSALVKILSGSASGLEVPLVKVVTTFGKPGVAVVAITHRPSGFVIAHVDGDSRPLLQGMPLGDDATPLNSGDMLEIAGTKMQFVIT